MKAGTVQKRDVPAIQLIQHPFILCEHSSTDDENDQDANEIARNHCQQMAIVDDAKHQLRNDGKQIHKRDEKMPYRKFVDTNTQQHHRRKNNDHHNRRTVTLGFFYGLANDACNH